MTTKPKKQTTPEIKKLTRKAVPVYSKPDDSEEDVAREYSKLAVSPALAAYRVINGAENKSGFGEHIDVPTLLDILRDQSEAVNRGDLSRAEAMLMSQATALQSLFARLAERGMGCDVAPAFEANMRMALRAQSQCRATLETLSAIKNPPVVYTKQANFANGPQQINNGMAAPSQAGEKEIQPSKLLEAQHGNYVDTGTAGTASGANSQLATMGKVDRAEVAGRQSEGFAER